MYQNARWRALRKAQLEAHPLCEACLSQGRVTEARVCDHVLPHKGDVVKFWAGPFQSLCKHHHDVKTIMEDGGLNSGASTHPEWLPLPACPVVLVTGSPGSGKTTYARKHARPLDQVIDLDDCFTDVCGVHGHEADRQYLKPALRLRNKMLAALSHKAQGRAYVIVGSPSTDETQWWIAKLGATHVRMEASLELCLSRVTPARQQAVRQWHEQARADVWAKPRRYQGADADGMPVDVSHPWNAA